MDKYGITQNGKVKEWAGEDAEFLSWGFYDKKQLIKDSSRYGLDIGWLSEAHRSLKHEYQAMNSLSRGLGVSRALTREKLTFTGTPHRGIDDAKNIAKIYLKAFRE